MVLRSTLLDTRPLDQSPTGFHSWPFMTVHNWGEYPKGVWMLEIHNEGRYEGENLFSIICDCFYSPSFFLIVSFNARLPLCVCVC